MSYEIVLIAALALPTLLFVLLRINAALIFLSLCLGAVLVEYVAGEANSLLTLFSSQAGSLSATTIQLTLLLAPAVGTCVITLLSVRGRLKNLFNIFPAASASALAVLLAVPLLSPGLRRTLENEAIWEYLVRGQALVVGVGAFVSLAFLWTQRRTFKERDKRHR